MQGCRISNEKEYPYPVILSVPHAAILDCTLRLGSGRVNAYFNDSTPGQKNVFTMERCLVEGTTGAGLFVASEDDIVAQALVANNRFINVSESPLLSPFPVVGHSDEALLVTFRDNYVFLPAEALPEPLEEPPEPARIGPQIHAHVIENNVYETDLDDDTNFFIVDYGVPNTDVRYRTYVRNERFVSPDDGFPGIRPGLNSNFDPTRPWGYGFSAIGDVIQLGENTIQFLPDVPASGTFKRGDLVFSTASTGGSPHGWVCSTAGVVGAGAVFTPLPLIASSRWGSGGGQLDFHMGGMNQPLPDDYLSYQTINCIDTFGGTLTLTVFDPAADVECFARIFVNSSSDNEDLVVTTGAGATVTVPPATALWLRVDTNGVFQVS